MAKHEFTLSMLPAKEALGVTAMDVAKGLLDMGYMAPTVYFPLVVPECLTTEPTETEAKDTLDQFAKDFVAVVGIQLPPCMLLGHHAGAACRRGLRGPQPLSACA